MEWQSTTTAIISRVRCQRFLNGFYRQKQFKFVGRQGDKAKLFVVAFGFLVLGVHEEANPARGVENLDKLSQRGHQQCFPDALSLKGFFGDANRPNLTPATLRGSFLASTGASVSEAIWQMFSAKNPRTGLGAVAAFIYQYKCS